MFDPRISLRRTPRRSRRPMLNISVEFGDDEDGCLASRLRDDEYPILCRRASVTQSDAEDESSAFGLPAPTASAAARNQPLPLLG